MKGRLGLINTDDNEYAIEGLAAVYHRLRPARFLCDKSVIAARAHTKMHLPSNGQSINPSFPLNACFPQGISHFDQVNRAPGTEQSLRSNRN